MDWYEPLRQAGSWTSPEAVELPCDKFTKPLSQAQCDLSCCILELVIHTTQGPESDYMPDSGLNLSIPEPS